MITAKTFNPGDVVAFKLTSGEELIARISEVNTDHYILTKPMALVNIGSSLGMQNVPVAASTQDSVMLNKHAVAMHGKCQQDLANQYLEKTTGLTLATSM